MFHIGPIHLPFHSLLLVNQPPISCPSGLPPPASPPFSSRHPFLQAQFLPNDACILLKCLIFSSLLEVAGIPRQSTEAEWAGREGRAKERETYASSKSRLRGESIAARSSQRRQSSTAVTQIYPSSGGNQVCSIARPELPTLFAAFALTFLVETKKRDEFPRARILFSTTHRLTTLFSPNL